VRELPQKRQQRFAGRHAFTAIRSYHIYFSDACRRQSMLSGRACFRCPLAADDSPFSLTAAKAWHPCAAGTRPIWRTAVTCPPSWARERPIT
jgi:hypothetical protein